MKRQHRCAILLRRRNDVCFAYGAKMDRSAMKRWRTMRWALKASSRKSYALLLSIGTVESLDQSQKSKGTRSNSGG